MNTTVNAVPNVKLLDPQAIGLRYIRSGDELFTLSNNTIVRFRNLIRNLYATTVRETGIQVRFVDTDPYHDAQGKVSSKVMRAEVERTGILEVTTLFNNSNLLGEEVNLLFRAYHDICHVQTGGSFSFYGEATAAIPLLRACDSFLHQDIAFSEIIAQRAAYEVLGDFGEGQAVVLGWGPELALLGL